jgi:nitrogen fixation NifU-like protein
MENDKFDFWQDNSVHYLEMAFRSDKRERIENPDGYGKRTGQCGDSIEMFLTIQDGRVKSASFDIDGCLNTMACANTVVYFAEGKTIEEAWGIGTEMVADYLETLPSNDAHCAELAVGAFYLALSNSQGDKGLPTEKKE